MYPMRGNEHFGNADITLDESYARTQALLAIAQEQRLANLIALIQYAPAHERARLFREIRLMIGANPDRASFTEEP